MAVTLTLTFGDLTTNQMLRGLQIKKNKKKKHLLLSVPVALRLDVISTGVQSTL